MEVSSKHTTGRVCGGRGRRAGPVQVQHVFHRPPQTRPVVTFDGTCTTAAFADVLEDRFFAQLEDAPSRMTKIPPVSAQLALVISCLASEPQGPAVMATSGASLHATAPCRWASPFVRSNLLVPMWPTPMVRWSTRGPSTTLNTHRVPSFGADDRPSRRRVQAHRETPRLGTTRSKPFFSLEQDPCRD